MPELTLKKDLDYMQRRQTVFCNVASGNEKGLVEGLVGFVRRNTLVPVPHVNDIDELKAPHLLLVTHENATLAY